MKITSTIIFALCLTCGLANSAKKVNADDKNIVQLAEELGATTLVSFVKDAGLAEALTGTGKFRSHLVFQLFPLLVYTEFILVGLCRKLFA